jgi:Cof subfamily protein (haloacid dehalogenase superfamily)
MGLYKMLVLDLDDTLLRDDHTISLRNKEALIQLQEKGYLLVLASGRPTQAMLAYAEELKLARYGSYIISYNGAVLSCAATGTVLFKKCLSVSEIHDLHNFASANSLDIITYVDEQIVSATDSEYIQIEVSLTGLPFRMVSCFKSAVTAPSVKCIMLSHPEILAKYEPILKSVKPELSVSISKPFFLEVMPSGIDKSSAIEYIANMRGINRSEIVAVGNAGNDLGMVQYAGLGVWVDNVPYHLRHCADAIVASNMDDGVAEVADKYFLKE